MSQRNREIGNEEVATVTFKSYIVTFITDGITKNINSLFIAVARQLHPEMSLSELEKIAQDYRTRTSVNGHMDQSILALQKLLGINIYVLSNRGKSGSVYPGHFVGLSSNQNHDKTVFLIERSKTVSSQKDSGTYYDSAIPVKIETQSS